MGALIADNGMRARDERFADQDRYKQLPDPLYDKGHPVTGRHLYQPRDFAFDPVNRTCICPAGCKLYRHGSNCVINGYAVIKFQGAQRDCLPCSLRNRCLRTPETTKTRQVAIFLGKTSESYTDRMKRRIDSPSGRLLYGRRFAVVEPVFGNLRHNKGLRRFTLRGRVKVNAQWQLFCLVHNIEKLAHLGYAN